MMTKGNNKPFRQTKKLVRIALDDAWTQKQIADKARVSQSIVSGWANGKAKAKQHQIEFLLEEYGDRLRKETSLASRGDILKNSRFLLTR